MVAANKPRIVFIGAGNLATNLAIAIYNSGCQIVQVYSRTKESAVQLSQRVESAYATDIKDVIQGVDLYIISVPDKAIQSVVDELKIPNGIVVHTSGSTDIQILSKFSAKGYGVFYPFQTFSKNRIILFNNIPICLNADSDETYAFLSRIALMVSSKAIRLDSETFKWLHLSGVFVNNFTNHLLAISNQISNEKGFSYDLLKPLIEETIAKAFSINPINAQTGPAIRFDQNTINLHIEKLKEYSPELADIYKALTLSIQSLARKT